MRGRVSTITAEEQKTLPSWVFVTGGLGIGVLSGFMAGKEVRSIAVPLGAACGAGIGYGAYKIYEFFGAPAPPPEPPAPPEGGEWRAEGTVLASLDFSLNILETGPPGGYWVNEGEVAASKDFSIIILETGVDYYTLSISIVPEGVGTVEPPAGEYPYGVRIDLYAEATDPDYEFHRWGGAASGTDPHTSINMYGDRSVRAEFTLKEIPPEEVSFTIRGVNWPSGAAYWTVQWWYPPNFNIGYAMVFQLPISTDAVAVDVPAYGGPEFTVYDRYPAVGVVPIYRSYDKYGHSGLAFEAEEGATYIYDFSTETMEAK